MRKLKRVCESNSSPESVELGGYSWTKIGELNGYPLYLCNKVVIEMPFDKSEESNEWKDSDIRKWLNTDFYRTLTKKEKSQVVPYNGDKLFLLSKDEYKKFERNITKMGKNWWLRSPVYDQDYYVVDACNYYNLLDDFNVGSKRIFVRPAVLLNYPLDREKMDQLLNQIRDLYSQYRELGGLEGIEYILD